MLMVVSVSAKNFPKHKRISRGWWPRIVKCPNYYVFRWAWLRIDLEV